LLVIADAYEGSGQATACPPPAAALKETVQVDRRSLFSSKGLPEEFRKGLRTFLRDRRGNMAFMMIATLVAVSLIAGGVIDYSSLVSQRLRVKEAANSAALAAAAEMLLVGATEQQALEVAAATARANLDGAEADVAVSFATERQVEVAVSVPPRTFFPGPVGLSASTITERSAAEIAGEGNVCVIALSDADNKALDFQKGSRLTAGACLVYSNSTAQQSMSVHQGANVQADFVCVSGGVFGDINSVSGKVLEDCPPVADPLSARPDPWLAGAPCNYKNPVIVTGAQSLGPGVYCGGIVVTGPGAIAQLNPGVYVIRDSLLEVSNGGTLEGDYVGFFLQGDSSQYVFHPDSIISLSAPKSGDMSGLLVFQRASPSQSKPNIISSDNAERLVGTIYQPDRRLLIEAKAPVAAQSEYTVMVARTLELGQGPELVLNTDYGSSDIPVPLGLGNNASNTVRLTR